MAELHIPRNSLGLEKALSQRGKKKEAKTQKKKEELEKKKYDEKNKVVIQIIDERTK